MDEPIANSSWLSLPRSTAPASARRRTAVASYGGAKASRILEPHVVRISRVQKTSFSAMGTPSSGPSGRPARKRRSAARASARARSRVTVRYAFTCGSSASIRARYASATSLGVVAPLRNRSPSARADSWVSTPTPPRQRACPWPLTAAPAAGTPAPVPNARPYPPPPSPSPRAREHATPCPAEPTLTRPLSPSEGQGVAAVPSPPPGERARVRGRAGCEGHAGA